MDKRSYLSAMKKKYPEEHALYTEAVKAMDMEMNFDVLDRLYRRMDEEEKASAFGIKLALDMAAVCYNLGDRERALRLGAKCLKLAASSGDRDMAADAEYVNGWLLVRENRVGEAVQHLKKCLALAEKLGIHKLVAWATVETAQCARANGDLQYELELLQKAYRVAAKSKDLMLELYALCSISTLYNEITDLEASCAYVEKAIAKLKAIKKNMRISGGLPGSVNALEPQLMVRYAIVCYRCGRCEEALSLAEQVRAGPAGKYPVNPRKAIYLIASLSLFERGENEKALEYAALGIEEEAAYRDAPYYEIVYLTYRLMDRLLALGRFGEALKIIEFTAETVANRGAMTDLRLSWRMYARLYEVAGERDKRLEALERYMECMEAYNHERSEQIYRGIRNQIRLDEEVKRKERQKIRQQMKLSKAQAEREAALYLSDHDALTGLYTRSRLNKDLKSELFANMASCGIIYFDVNDLKLTNDVYGHEVGDLLLQNAAKSLKIFDDERYCAYRMGGDEFMLVICNCEDYELDMAMEKWHAEITRLNEEADIKCAVAAGFAYGAGKFDIEALMRKADERMYENKRTLKSREGRKAKMYEVYDPA